jgi:hypothetical protein
MWLSGTVLAVLLIGGAVVAAAAAPRIEIPQARHTFAPVAEGETVDHEFVLRNLGDAELEIYQVRTG